MAEERYYLTISVGLESGLNFATTPGSGSLAGCDQGVPWAGSHLKAQLGGIHF